MKNNMNMIMTKITGILILAGIVSIIVYYYSAFSGTTWGGWEPPDVSLDLNSKERELVRDFEKKNQCSFDYIGLDRDYTEDSIIHMNLYCKENSELGKNIYSVGEKITMNYCNSFLSSSNSKRPQKYIQITFYKILIEGEQYPVTFKYLYSKISDSLVKIE